MRVSYVLFLSLLASAHCQFDEDGEMIPMVDLWDFETTEEPLTTEITEELYTTPVPLTTEPAVIQGRDVLLEAADASCNIGYYSPSGFTTCIPCEKGTFSSFNQQQTSCSLCAPGKFAALDGMGQCSACPAGTFSYSDGSSMCTSCPPWTGSFSSMSSCVTCSNSSGLCLYADQTSCPVCGSACVLCNAGYYNEGGGGSCVACSAGKYNDVRGAMGPMQCYTCGVGTYARKSSSGLTACLSCSLVSGYPAPTFAAYIPSDSGGFSEFMCKWTCNSGFAPGEVLPSETQRINSFNTYVASPNLFSDIEANEMIRLKYSYCCNIVGVLKGTYLKGCTKTDVGLVTACPGIPNAHHVDAEAQINKCAFWECDDGFYLSSGQCVAQSVCNSGFTYRRKSDGSMHPDLFENTVAVPLPGKFVCVICPVCANGTEAAVQCNRTYSAVCRMCGGNRPYSVNGNACLENVPYGYRAVKESRTLSYIPWGERPLWLSDNTPVQATSQVFFSFVQCMDAGYGRTFKGGDEVCTLTVSQGCTQCMSQCSPWRSDGAGRFSGIGFYGADSQPCNVCVFDGARCSASSNVQFLNMSTCGPTQMPQCENCPAVKVDPNQEGWITPTESTFNGIYPCMVRCAIGFSAYNDVCIACPDLPLNVKLTRGCEWECKQGFLKSADRKSCVACPEPSACDTGYYRDYNDTVNVCLGCMGCEKLSNSAFTSSGVIDKDRASCGYRCNAGYYDNRGCYACAVKTCVNGGSFLKQCTATEDATCINCKQCSVWEKVDRACTVSNDTVCVSCESSLLPQNASWSAVGCVSWSCKQGFWLDGSVCKPCNAVGECALGFQLVDIPQCINGNPYTAARGGCDACTPPPIGKCFSGGSNCGLMACVVLTTTSTTSVTQVLTTVPLTTTKSLTVTTLAPVLITTATTKSLTVTTLAPALITTATAKSSGSVGTTATPMLTTTTTGSLSTVKTNATSVLNFNLTSAKTSTNTTAAKNSTSTPATTPAIPEPVAYATVASLAISETEITAVMLDTLVNNVSEVVCTADIILCNISVLSVTVNNVTTFCKDSVCPGYQRRRVLLAVKEAVGVSLGILTSRLVSDFSSGVRSLPSVSAVTVYPNAPLTNAQLETMKDSRAMAGFVRSESTVFYVFTPPSGSNGISGLVVIAVLAGVFVLFIAAIVACCCCCCYYSQTPVKKKLVPTTRLPSNIELIVPSGPTTAYDQQRPPPYNPAAFSPAYYPPPPFNPAAEVNSQPFRSAANIPSITNIRITKHNV